MVKKSKIPFLKRQSLQEDRNSKIIAARDKVRLRNNSTMSDPDTNDEEAKDDSHRKEVTENTVKNYGDNEFAVTHTKTVITSRANGEDDNIKVISTATVTDVKTIESCDSIEPNKSHMIVENIQKEFVKVGIPVFESYVLDHTEKIEGEKTVAVKNILAYTTNNNDLEIVNIINDIDNIDGETGNLIEITEINDENKLESTESAKPNSIHSIENDFIGLKPEATPEEQIVTVDTHMNERDGIFDPLLRGKERPLRRLLSHETINKDALEIDSGNKLPKKESVMSKIALFEVSS